MQNNLTVVILAAGEGKRMRPLGQGLPKIMLPILGKPVLDYVITNLIEAGIENIILIVSPTSSIPVKKYFGSSFKEIKIDYVVQKEQLGPAQAISLALPKIKTPYFLVQYGDSLAQNNVAQKVIETLGKNQDIDGVLAVRSIDDPSRYGIVKYKNGYIAEVIEKPTHPPSNHALIGTYILKTDFFKKAIEDEKFQYGSELFPAQYILAKGGQMASYLFKGKRVDVGKPEDLFKASQLLTKSPVKCIAFDADNTLYNSHLAAGSADIAAIEMLSKRLKKSSQNLYKQWQKIVNIVKDSNDPNERTRLYSYGQLCARHNISNPQVARKMFTVFANVLLKNLKATRTVKEILKKLPHDKYVITDDITQLAEKKLNYLGLRQFFKEIITSDRIGITKPSKKFYESLLKIYTPSEILVVGDDWKKDLGIPAQLGMQVLFVENEDSLKKLLSISGSTSIHIMGIAGAGAAAVAGIAKGFGYNVTGCDISPNSPYTENLDINIEKSHHANHVKDIDMLIVSPAIEKTDPENPELQTASGLNLPILSWQEFQGKYLQRDKFVICVAGAYGKSTTTAMTSQILIDAGLDPTCEIGAKVIEWNSNFRVGKSKYYVCEADEYNNNFLNYHPDIAIILNLGWDHPDFFKTKESVLESYKKFIANIKPQGTLVIPSSHSGGRRPIESDRDAIASLQHDARPDIKVAKVDDFGKLNLSIIGDFRKENANAAVAVAEVLGINTTIARRAVQNFKGTGRRLEYKGEKKGVKFYDDYAVQPYTVLKTANALKQKFARQKVTLVFEPHTFSRINTFFDEFLKSLKDSKVDEILITDVFAAREIGDKKELAQKLANALGAKAKYTGSIEQTATNIKKHLKNFSVVCSMGAGDSYKLYDLVKLP